MNIIDIIILLVIITIILLIIYNLLKRSKRKKEVILDNYEVYRRKPIGEGYLGGFYGKNRRTGAETKLFSSKGDLIRKIRISRGIAI